MKGTIGSVALPFILSPGWGSNPLPSTIGGIWKSAAWSDALPSVIGRGGGSLEDSQFFALRRCEAKGIDWEKAGEDGKPVLVRLIFLEVLSNGRVELDHMMVMEAVKHLPPFFSVAHQSIGPQGPELMRNGRVRD